MGLPTFLLALLLVLPGSPGEDWQVLFDGRSLQNWAVSRFGGEGDVYVREEQLILEMGNDLTGITWAGDFPKSGYEVLLEAMRVEGNDFFCGLTFPVGEAFCTLIVGGWAGPVVGISSIDGQDASDNETTVLRRFESSRWYQIRLKVTRGKIEAWIDQEQVVDLATQGRKLGIRPEVDLSRPFGIASWRTTAALRYIHMRRIE